MKLSLQALRNELEKGAMTAFALIIISSIVIAIPCRAQEAQSSAYSEIPENIDRTKYIDLARKYYLKSISSNLFSTMAEHSTAIPLRSKILYYTASNNLDEAETTAETKWQEYISNTYKNKKEFQNKLKNSYLSEDFVKSKFKQNISLFTYFDKVIVPKVDNDLALRKKILDNARERKIGFSKNEIKEKYYQTIENFGSEAAFETFLRNNNFTVKEFLFFIESDLLHDKLTQLTVEERINNDPELMKINQMQDKDQYFYQERISLPEYYFRIAYINKDKENAASKIRDAQKLFKTNKRVSANPNIDRDIEIYEPNEPYREDSTLYSKRIRETLASQVNSNLMIIENISPVLSNEQGYYVLDLYKVNQPETNVSYQKFLNKRRAIIEAELE